MKQERDFSQLDNRKVIPLFLGIYLPLVVITLTITGTYFGINMLHEQQLILEEQTLQVELSQQSIERDIRGIFNELKYLTDSDSLMRFTVTQDERTRSEVEAWFALFMRHIDRYAQIRWLDMEGRERLRIERRNGKVTIVTPEALQDKSKRYYFIQTSQLMPGELYISPLDLNIEHGEVEQPFQPVLRIGTPTINPQGERNGLLVFNYRAELLLNNFALSKHQSPGELNLLNRDGYWLYADGKAREWGFMLGHEQRFGDRYQQAWEAIRSQPQGTLTTDNGLFLFSRVDILKIATAEWRGALSETLNGDERGQYWTVVARYPREHFYPHYRENVGLYGVMMLLTVLILSWLVWKLTKAIWERNQLTDKLALHAKVMETATNGVMIVDSQRHIVAINRAFTDLTGYSREEALGNDPLMLASDPQDAGLFDGIQQNLDETGHWEGEIWNRHKNGQIYPEWVTISVVRGHAKDSLHYIAIFSLLSQQKSTEARLRELASTDPLTGLINRSLLYDRAGQTLAHSHRHQRRAAFLFLDLDHFKPVNDELGHEAGDQVLKTVAKRILACVRESDTVARYGGDEFMVVLTDLKENEEAAAIAEKIRHGLTETITLAEGECRVGVSIGISLYPDDGDTVDELIQHADQAMYWAKEQGRGRIAFYHNL